MNEQEQADRFSAQIDRLLQGDRFDLSAESEEIVELLNLGKHLAQTNFQATTMAQAVFQHLLSTWFGLTNGGSTMMTILGLSKAWIITIFTAVTVVVVGTGIIVIVTDSEDEVSVVSETDVSTAEPGDTITPTVTMTGTTTMTGSLTITDTPTITSTPVATDPVTLVFQSGLSGVKLCQGAYSSQAVLVNYGSTPIVDAGLVWEVIEGDELVEDVTFASEALDEEVDDEAVDSATLVSTNETTTPTDTSLDEIEAGEEVSLDVNVAVSNTWWSQPDGTEIKVQLGVEGSDSNQIVTIVKQGQEWVTLGGMAYPYGEDALLIDGNIVVIDDCTGLPEDWPSESGVQVVGILLEDGTFMAITIIVMDGDLIIINFDSGRGEETTDVSAGSGGSGGSTGGSGDHDRGHGNDADGYDEDNPGNSKRGD